MAKMYICDNQILLTDGAKLKCMIYFINIHYKDFGCLQFLNKVVISQKTKII